MSNVDEHIWAEILTRLPAKAVGRARCICKAWNSLISSSFFLSKHLSFLAHNNEPPLPICYIVFDPTPQWCELVNFTFYKPEELNAPTFSPLPFSDPNHRFRWNPVGVVHGIVCLARENKSESSLISAGSSILWNPTIGKHLLLPDGPSVGWLVIGLGFDDLTNDFKVVRVLQDKIGSHRPPIYEVFSTLKGCWRTLASNHIFCRAPDNFLLTFPSFMNGSIHWVARQKSASGYLVANLLVFDCREEELKTMELPKGLREFAIFGLGDWGGVLSVWATHEVWEMREYGNADSWKKLTTWPTRHFVTIDKVGVLFDERAGWVEENGYDLIPRSAQPLNGGLFQPSLFLLDKLQD